MELSAEEQKRRPKPVRDPARGRPSRRRERGARGRAIKQAQRRRERAESIFVFAFPLKFETETAKMGAATPPLFPLLLLLTATGRAFSSDSGLVDSLFATESSDPLYGIHDEEEFGEDDAAFRFDGDDATSSDNNNGVDIDVDPWRMIQGAAFESSGGAAGTPIDAVLAADGELRSLLAGALPSLPSILRQHSADRDVLGDIMAGSLTMMRSSSSSRPRDEQVGTRVPHTAEWKACAQVASQRRTGNMSGGGDAAGRARTIRIFASQWDMLPSADVSRRVVDGELFAQLMASSDRDAVGGVARELRPGESFGPPSGAPKTSSATGTTAAGRGGRDTLRTDEADDDLRGVLRGFEELSTAVVTVHAPVFYEYSLDTAPSLADAGGSIAAVAYTHSHVLGFAHPKCVDLAAAYALGYDDDDTATTLPPPSPSSSSSWPVVPLTLVPKPRNYYHNLVEVLSRVWVADVVFDSKVRFLVAPRDENPMQHSLLDMYGLPAHRRVEVSASPLSSPPPSSSRRTVFQSGMSLVMFAAAGRSSGLVSSPSHFRPPRIVLRGLQRHLHLRNQLVFPAPEQVAAQHDQQPVVLYIRRHGIREIEPALERQLLDALRRALRQQDGERQDDDYPPAKLDVFDSKGVPLAEQARRFAKADVVLGAYGSGLANILFCSSARRRRRKRRSSSRSRRSQQEPLLRETRTTATPATTPQVIELPTLPYLNNVFGYLAEALGLGYWVVPEFRSLLHRRFEGLSGAAVDAVVRTVELALKEALWGEGGQ